MQGDAQAAQAAQLTLQVEREEVARLVACSRDQSHVSFDAGKPPGDAQPYDPRVDLEDFAAFIREHERRVRSVLRRLLDDDRDVEEATQDVFVQAWRKLPEFRGDAQVSTWLYRIAVNEALQRRRRRGVQVTELDIALAEPEREDVDLRNFLLGCLRRLPIELRAAVVLRDVEGLSNEEVAQVLGVTLAAAKSRIHRGRMQVRAALEEWES